jgi:broad specificity phosphatase PhoE
MTRFLCFFTVLLTQGIVVGQLPAGMSGKTKIYLIRHAEKETGDDPVLTGAGNKRAGDLLRTLKNKHITHIYVTEFKRTQLTGDSLRIQSVIDTLHYIADTTGNDILNKIITHAYEAKTILIIGHSNTIPKIIRKLGATDFPSANIPAGEFDNLYLLRYKKGKAVVKAMKYGEASAVSAAMY